MEFDQHKDRFALPRMANNHQYNSLLYPPQMPAYRNISLQRQETPVASSSLLLNNVPSTSAAVSGLPQSSFRAPAHKHAHHLHSIPPREKSTRTLIIDHMLWVHGRTRFAQARAELGMTDRTGGPTSPNYIHRKRPESYEEEDEDGSEGEEIVALRARSGGPGHPHNDDEDERLGSQDLSLARSLRLRAEGLEKVVISMLEQSPPIHTLNNEDITTPPTSPKLNASSSSHPHRLPNGVRLRLALGTIINDLFARQAPLPPYRHTRAPNTKISTPPDHSPSVPPSSLDLPYALTALAPVSGAFAPASHIASHRSIQSPQYTDYSSGYPTSTHQNYGSPASPRNLHLQYPTIQQQQQALGPPIQPRILRPHPSGRTRSLYAVGADPSTANSPPAFRCPRHLHTGCEICVEAKSPARQTGSSHSRGRGRAGSFGGGGGGGGGGVGSGRADRHSAASNSWKAMPGGVGPGGGGITGWQDGSGIGSGLLRPGVRGSALRRKNKEEGGRDAVAGAGNTKLSKLIPRFIRLSALVAAELGREARGEEGEGDGESASEDGKDGQAKVASGAGTAVTPRGSASGGSRGTPGGGYSPLPASPSLARASVQAQDQVAHARMYEFALRPSSEWYMLLAGLLTRAVLEGYLTAGWTGLQAVQCLLLVGLGVNEGAGKEKGKGKERDQDRGDEEEEREEEDDEDEEEEFSSLDPDELPTLLEAIKILFPSLRDGNMSGLKAKGEEDYEIEMNERLKRFYEIPASTPDCATHMEDLAWQYPAEPVERAAVRFCEAIAKWRGKPELETYKKKPPAISPPLDVVGTSPGGSTTTITIESLVHSNPSSPMIGNNNHNNSSASSSSRHPHRNNGSGSHGSGTSGKKRLRKPSIDVYFLQGTGRRESISWSSRRGSASASAVSVNRGGSGSGSAGATSGGGGGGNGNKRSRDAEDDGGRPGAAKRMFNS